MTLVFMHMSNMHITGNQLLLDTIAYGDIAKTVLIQKRHLNIRRQQSFIQFTFIEKYDSNLMRRKFIQFSDSIIHLCFGARPKVTGNNMKYIHRLPAHPLPLQAPKY
ncbi:hypothetical protein BMS3Bbin14_01027 [bacterium BMS3Bbin14]|nr:hypothetical protein BMS3Bbin14_01027 [bacterium BMS3Bbin14]